jgi:hypothetical protein
LNQNPLPNCQKNEMDILLEENKGIISFMKNDDSNSVIVSSSSNSQYLHRILSFDDSYWYSSKSENSWISFQFKHNPVKLSGYLLRSHRGPSYPIGWKLEASKDGNNWKLIDEKSGSNYFQTKQQVVTFPCQLNDYYSFFKFTQTEKNQGKDFSFNLNFVEFWGRVIEE